MRNERRRPLMFVRVPSWILSGKVYVITCGSAGIGCGILAHILQHGLANSLFSAAFEQLRQNDWIAKQLASKLDLFNKLILKAGLVVKLFALAKDCIDSHTQVNVFAQNHLAMTLPPKLISTPHVKLKVMEEITTDIGELELNPCQAPYIIAIHPGGVVTDQQDQVIETYGTVGKVGVAADETDGRCILPYRKVTEVSNQGKDDHLGA
ncbi:hypothetical protein BKA67DRAFT_683617 [Truncatella angustata]|uniref:Uncharacterized protein n=1 Tax=Truncatella angustata TaxID=152316 RepID=A0A9P8UE01_9PEZI|nr:uncharacterized protein BKA67DRAFT_683617 [Truncatella angustata]KAH6648179.1 hypothetical protein BKA67DRAFT_683617 [Truncatella angustata]